MTQRYNISKSDLLATSDGKQLGYEEESEVRQQVPRTRGSELPIKEGAVFGSIGVVVTYLMHLYLSMVASA
ncbi:hypothetical protein [Natrinema caseinilyticum]|uniref:hypothetical protein n=1 Tax=Natrinema caseinilyticum TaxID=2961570 RepID=UPI0020C4DDE1|nr:hypothetical protein [Natrinema caseinilyticum]